MATTTERNITSRLPTNDVFQLSSGVGHHYRPGYYFPDSNFKSVLHAPLPADLCRPAEVIPSDHFKTSTGEVHDPKSSNEPCTRSITFKQAPAHWNIHYLKDHREKLGKGGWRRPLSPSNQKSETIDEFDNKPGLYEPERWRSIQPFNLENHHTEGPSKQVIASTVNPKLGGRELFPKDNEVLRHMDPYLTTSMRYHRAWDPRELKGYPKKDAGTYWDCEDYPKVWGHGLKHNPLPKTTIPRERPPMRDTLIFKTARSDNQVYRPLAFLPHSGLKTLYSDSYVTPSDVKGKEAVYCPVDTPYTLPVPGPRTSMSAPGMYKTEYMNIGRRLPVLV